MTEQELLVHIVRRNLYLTIANAACTFALAVAVFLLAKQ